MPVNHKTSLTIAIVSDLHAVSSDSKDHENTYLTSSMAVANDKNPVSSLCRLVDEENLKADALVCCGDMGNIADAGGIRYAWKQIHKIKNHLKTKNLIATCGNHDVNLKTPSTRWKTLKTLNPLFPSNKYKTRNSFWKSHYFIQENKNYRFIVLNSAAHCTNETELGHGYISENVIQEIAFKLKRKPKKLINIFVCHHHPHKHMEKDLGEYDEMRNGQLLLKLLGDSVIGDWIVIHGHKHHPKIQYASGNSSAPTVFSAGSLSAKINCKLGVRNQFHIIKFPFKDIQSLGPVGIFKTWEWGYTEGWRPSKSESGLPYIGGFGFRKYNSLAKDIKKILGRKPFISWNDIKKKIPQVQYLLPDDLKSLLESLEEVYKINYLLTPDLEVAQIGRFPRD